MHHGHSKTTKWTSGCTLKCPGCWNPETHKHGQGTRWNDYELANHIRLVHDVTGVTFSGGDPIQQIDSLVRVVDHIHMRRPDFSIGIYTGYTLKELEEVGPTIPDDITELFRKVIELCKEAGCFSVDLKVQPSWKGSFHGQVQVQWSSGRHGAPSQCLVRTELTTHLEV